MDNKTLKTLQFIAWTLGVIALILLIYGILRALFF